MYFRETKLLTKMKLGTNFDFTEVLQDCCCLLQASMKEQNLLPEHGFKCALHVIIQMESHNQH